MAKSAELKTKVNEASVEGFLNTVKDEQARAGCFEILKIMKQVTKEEPKMWGAAIVGFGTYTYKYTSGQSGDWPLAAFSPRKQNLTIYIMSGFEGYEELIAKVGKCKTSKACLYVKKLDDLHIPTLKALIKKSVAETKKKYK